MAIDSGQRRLFAVCSGNATLIVFDLDTHRVITSLKIGGGPDSVALDPTFPPHLRRRKSWKIDRDPARTVLTHIASWTRYILTMGPIRWR